MKLEWKQQDIYDVLLKSGLAGLLKERYNLKMEQETNGSMSDEDKVTLEVSLELIDEEIERKVTHSGKLYFLQSTDTNLPYIDCYDMEMDFRSYLFTSLDRAEQYAKRLLIDGYPVEVMEILTGKNRSYVYQSMMYEGVMFLIMNPGEYEYPMSINQLSDIFTYDGFLDLEHPLVNCRLNALLSCYTQDISARKQVPGMEEKIFELMEKGYFEIPVVIDGLVDRLDHQETAFHYVLFPLEDKNNVQQLTCPVFTDNESLDHWAQNIMHLDDYNRIIVPFSDLLNIAQTYNVKNFIFNWHTHALSLGHDKIFNMLKEN